MGAVDLETTALVDANLVAEYLKESVPIAPQVEDLLNLMINGVTEQVEQYCRRPFITRAFTEYHDGNGESELALRNLPIVSVTSVDRIDEDGSSLASYVSSDFVNIARRGVLRFTDNRAFWAGRENWKVVYTAGLGATRDVMPHNVRVAAMIGVAMAWREFDQKRQDLESLSIEGESTTFIKDPLPKMAMERLKHYRVPA